MPHLHVFPRTPDGKFPGWDGQRDPSTLLCSEQWEASTLDRVCDDGDYRFAAYTVPGEESIPRLNLAALPVLEGLGAEAMAIAAVVDVDLPGHRKWASLAEATAHVDGVMQWAEEDENDLLYNAAFYTTRAGYRLMWMLTTPLPVSQYRAMMRLLLAKLKEDHGIEADPTSVEWSRLFRMPACVRDGKVLETYADLEPLDDLTLDPYSLGTLEADDASSAVAGDHPEPLDDLDLDAWGATFKHPYLKAGRPFPPDAEGSTYGTLRRAISSCAHEGPVTDPEVLFALVHRSVDATPNRTRQEAWKMCVWTAHKQAGTEARSPQEAERPVRPEPLDQGTWDEWARAVSPRWASTLNRLRIGAAFTPKTQAETKMLNAAYHIGTACRLSSPVEMYRGMYPSAQASLVDASKLWEQCKAVTRRVQEEAGRASDDEKKAAVFCQEHPLVVAVPGANSFYMLDLREPAHPTYQLTDVRCLPMHFGQMLGGRLPFGAEVVDDKGKALSVDVILRQYGESATRIRYVAGQRGAQFRPDREGSALEIGVHSIHPDLRPVFHESIDKWLRLFGGSDPERFLDWLATCTLTDYPSCALYVHGLPGSGKSMLLQALASVWGGAPVPFGEVAADFNQSLLDSPIIAADEGVPADSGSLSEVFRNLVANSQHDIRIKYQPNATLHGCLRLVITANEMDALEFKKTLSGRSLQAIVERVLFIDQGRDPVDYLKGLGGRKGTAMWASGAPGQPGLIAEHLLWLRENRSVQAEGRFLVQGVMTDWHRQFIGQQGIKPDVIKVIALAAKSAAKLYGQAATSGVEVRRDRQCVVITKEAVASFWALQAVAAPRERILAKTLLQLDEKLALGMTRPRIGRNNPSAGTRGYAISFATLAASQYVTMPVLTGKNEE